MWEPRTMHGWVRTDRQNPNLTSIQLKSTLTAVGFNVIMTANTPPQPPDRKSVNQPKLGRIL